MTVISIAQALLDAADLIESEGWVQFTEFDPATGCYCAEGALKKVLGGRTDGTLGVPSRFFQGYDETTFYAAVEVVLDHLEEVGQVDDGGFTYPFLSEFNDQDGRTKQDVLRLLRAAAGA